MESCWMGVGRVNPISLTPRSRSGWSPKLEKGMRIESFRGFAGQADGRCHFIRLVFFGNGGIAGEAYVLGSRADNREVAGSARRG